MQCSKNRRLELRCSRIDHRYASSGYWMSSGCGSSFSGKRRRKPSGNDNRKNRRRLRTSYGSENGFEDASLQLVSIRTRITNNQVVM